MTNAAETSDHSLSQEELLSLETEGYIGPFDLMTPEEAKKVLAAISTYPDDRLPWWKARHAYVRAMYELGTQPAILERLKSILGPDIILWGSHIIRQSPHGRHRWHVDVEHAHWEGVTLWLALENVVPGECISVVTRSHTFDTTPQQIAKDLGTDLTDDEAVIAAARRHSAESRLVHVPIRDGQFFFFSGRAWHGTKNLTDLQRSAVIFQYTRPDSRVRIPTSFDYPHTQWSSLRPPVVLVHGEDRYGVNKLVPPEKIGNLSSRFYRELVYWPGLAIQGVASAWNAVTGR